MESIKHQLRRLMCFPIHIYRIGFRPFLPHSCRFYPSCSSYAIESIQQFGIVKGVFKTFKRLIRCHPWNPGGHDPVK